MSMVPASFFVSTWYSPVVPVPRYSVRNPPYRSKLLWADLLANWTVLAELMHRAFFVSALATLPSVVLASRCILKLLKMLTMQV